MTQRLPGILLGIGFMIVGNPLAVADSVQILPVDGSPQIRDLANLADAVGVRFRIFDYETAEPHCIHFYVEEVEDSGDVRRQDGHGLCGLAGPHRLTVQWKEAQDQVDFRFLRFRRDSEQGGSVAGPTVPTPKGAGFTEYAVEPPELAYGDETLLLRGMYGWNDGPRTEFRVLAELRRNPEGVIGTE